MLQPKTISMTQDRLAQNRSARHDLVVQRLKGVVTGLRAPAQLGQTHSKRLWPFKFASTVTTTAFGIADKPLSDWLRRAQPCAGYSTNNSATFKQCGRRKQ